jgi:hypothetical protein
MTTPVVGTRFPAIELGTKDISIEWWMNYYVMQDINSGDDTQLIGFPKTRTGADVITMAGFNWVGNPALAKSSFNDSTSGALQSASLIIPRGWHHWVINIDRNDTQNMFTYLDGTLLDTKDISAQIADMGTRSFVPMGFLGSSSGSPGLIMDTDEGWDLTVATDPGDLTSNFLDFDFPHVPVALGPIALNVHASLALITQSEMWDSIKARSVIDYSGITQVIYDWKNIEFDNEESWDTNPRHAFRGITDFPNGPIGIPRGADETVRIPNESSGSGDPLRLQTTATYGQDSEAGLVAVQDGLRGWHAFSTDQFFNRGGGVGPGL